MLHAIMSLFVFDKICWNSHMWIDIAACSLFDLLFDWFLSKQYAWYNKTKWQ